MTDWYDHRLTHLTRILLAPASDDATCRRALGQYEVEPAAYQVPMQLPNWLREEVSDVAAAFIDDDLPEHEEYGSDVWADDVFGFVSRTLALRDG